jgi:hypothetical protein
MGFKTSHAENVAGLKQVLRFGVFPRTDITELPDFMERIFMKS